MSVYDVASAEDVAALRDRVAALEAMVGRLGADLIAARDDAAADNRALRAGVARQDAAIRRLVAEQARDRAALLNLSAMLGMSKVDLGQVHDRLYHILHGLTVGAEPVMDPLEALGAPATDPAPDAERAWAVDALDFTTFGRDEAGNMARGPLPVPAAAAPAELPGPVADAATLDKFAKRAKSEAWALLASHGFNCCDNAEGSGLIAWRRDESAPTAQQQPALPADVREAMREAIDALEDAARRLRHPLKTAEQWIAGGRCLVASARLRELAGKP